MSFAPIPRLKIAEQVADTIRDAILRGRFRPGEPIPSERELADQFAVNRSTVREAIHRLEAWGLVEVRHGGATMVRDFLAHAGMQLLPYLIAPGGAVDQSLLRDLLELRAPLLGWTAGLAATCATPADLERLCACLAQLEAAETPEALQELDFAFFEHLVAASKNRVLLLLANAIRAVYLGNRELFRGLYQVGFDLQDHRRAVEAIAARDASAASSAMTAHGERPLAHFGGNDV